MDWNKLFAVIIALLLIWLLWRGIKGNPAMFSRESLGKSFGTMGILALALIAFIAFCVFLLRTGF
ncbi:MAG: hypothetical protein Tsb005_18070 [Gammaproteobacteria bacterium]